MSDRKRLLEIIREVSYREGDFTLASGQKTKHYIDLKNTALHPEGAHLIGSLSVDYLMQQDLSFDAQGGLAIGADPISAAIAVAAFQKNQFWPACIVRKESKGHGTDQYVEGTANFKDGAKILVIEDVVTTGGSGLKAAKRLKDAGFEPVGIYTIVDRLQGGREQIEKEGLALYSLFTLNEIQFRN